jgi:hypothetical protein
LSDLSVRPVNRFLSIIYASRMCNQIHSFKEYCTHKRTNTGTNKYTCASKNDNEENTYSKYTVCPERVVVSGGVRHQHTKKRFYHFALVLFPYFFSDLSTDENIYPRIFSLSVSFCVCFCCVIIVRIPFPKGRWGRDVFQ